MEATSPLPPSQEQPQTKNPTVYFAACLFWSCCSPPLGFDLPSRDEQRASSVILVLSSRSREKINRYGFYCVCAGVWSSCFSLNVSCLESNLGLSAPELAPNSSFLLPKTISELWIPSTARGCHLFHPFLRPPPSPVGVLSSKRLLLIWKLISR